MDDSRDVLEPALKLALQLGGLIVQSNNVSYDRNEQAAIQESIEWTREQLREARRDVERRIDWHPTWTAPSHVWSAAAPTIVQMPTRFIGRMEPLIVEEDLQPHRRGDEDMRC